VKIALLNNQHLAPSKTLIDKVQVAIDPSDISGDGYGIAPVGHKVTIVGPTLRTINVSVAIETTSTVTVEDVRQNIEKSIADYFATVRGNWGNIGPDNRTYNVTLYRSQIIVSLLKIDGVTNALNVKFDGVDADTTIQTDSKKEELPMLGTVTVNG